MFSAESSGFAPLALCCLIRFARCSAQARPAGPAPTIRTSASSCSRWMAIPAFYQTTVWRKAGICEAVKARICRALPIRQQGQCSSRPEGRPLHELLEYRSAAGGRAHLRRVDAEAKMREPRLAERHETRIEISPHEQQQEW